MIEQDIIHKVVTLLENNFPSFNVQTAGGGGEASLPAIIIEWSADRRSNIQGHDQLSGYTRDSQGNVTHIHLHHYYRMELDFTVKSYDEGERDNTITDVQDLFLDFEWESDNFHSDTFEWEVGNASPRNNPVIEPDWYESGVVVTFNFVKEVTKSVDAIESVQEAVSNDY